MANKFAFINKLAWFEFKNGNQFEKFSNLRSAAIGIPNNYEIKIYLG